MRIPDPRRPGEHREPQLPGGFKAVGAAFILWWTVCAIVGLGFLGVITWAIIKLVTWVVTL